MKISVCIVEDNDDIRSALEHIIKMNRQYKMAGSFSNADEAMEKLQTIQPHVVLMDINLGDGKSGIECVKYLRPKYPDMLFMMCTVYEDNEKIFEALASGANGYILKKTAPAELLAAIKELYEGGAPMSTLIARKVVGAFHGKQAGEPTDIEPSKKLSGNLSKREYETLHLLAKGMLYKEIAEQLGISMETVRKHVYHIYEKLHVTNRIEAVNRFFER